MKMNGTEFLLIMVITMLLFLIGFGIRTVDPTNSLVPVAYLFGGMCLGTTIAAEKKA